jgi:hypothetical protein
MTCRFSHNKAHTCTHLFQWQSKEKRPLLHIAAQIILAYYYEIEESYIHVHCFLQSNRWLRKLKSLHLNKYNFLEKVLILPSELQVGLPTLQLTRSSFLTKTLKQLCTSHIAKQTSNLSTPPSNPNIIFVTIFVTFVLVIIFINISSGPIIPFHTLQIAEKLIEMGLV